MNVSTWILIVVTVALAICLIFAICRLVSRRKKRKHAAIVKKVEDEKRLQEVLQNEKLLEFVIVRNELTPTENEERKTTQNIEFTPVQAPTKPNLVAQTTAISMSQETKPEPLCPLKRTNSARRFRTM